MAIENLEDICFEVKRIFYIYGNKKRLPRAGHANRQAKEALICLNGSCRVLLDDGEKQEAFLLERPDQILYIDVNVWVEIDGFTEDCILLVLASDHYNKDAYIEVYKEFKEMMK
ncbi:MAG: sugar 3,4-ketoisomerase [Desulfitobacterium sp.]